MIEWLVSRRRRRPSSSSDIALSSFYQPHEPANDTMP